MVIHVKKIFLFILLGLLSCSLMAQHVIKEEGIQIDEVVVTGKMPRIVIKKDTTIINTSAYKVPEGADLKDLVKRIPGLEYDEKTNTLTYNGKNIGEIDVNGEAFFMDNIRIALESLPADFVGQIKMYDKRSDREQATGIDDGIRNYVLDIQTKEEVNNTLLASLQLSAGNKKKKEIDGQLNYFCKGGENFTIFGKSTNESSNTLSKNNMSTSTGTNFMRKLGKKHTLRASLRYWQSEGESRFSYNMEQYLQEGNRYYSSMDEETFENKSFNTDLQWQWKINERWNLNVSGKVNLSNNSNISDSQSAIFNSFPAFDIRNPFLNWMDVPDDIKINHDRRRGTSKSDNNKYDWGMDVTYYLNKKGTNVNLSMSYFNYEGNSEHNSDNVTTYFQLKDKQGNDSVLFRNQYQPSPSSSRNWNSAIAMTHPVSKQVRLQIFYKWKSDEKDDERGVYDLSTQEKISIDSLGRSNYECVDSHELGSYINYSTDNWTVNTSLYMIPQRRELRSRMGEQWVDTTLCATNYSSSLYVSWGKTKLRTSFKYDFHTNQPSLSELVSLVDNNNPLYVTYGNPDLKTSCGHSMRWDIEDTKYGLSADVFGNIDQNKIVRTYDFNLQTGGSVSYPVNINGNWKIGTNMSWRKGIGKISLYLKGEAGYGNEVSLMKESDMEQSQRSITGRTSLNGRMQWIYNPEWGGFDSRTSFYFIRSLNSLRDKVTYSRIWVSYMEGYAELPGNIQLSMDVEATFQSGTNVQEGERVNVLWNAKVRWRFLKEKQAELGAYWKNILAENNSVYRYANAYSFSEVYSQNIRGYVMLTFKYKFRVIK